MKAYFRRVPGTLMVEIFVTGDPQYQINYYMTVEKGGVAMNQFKRDEGAAVNVKPLLTLPEMEAREFIAAMADVARDEGIEVKSETFVKGKLEATESHLKDMRTLLKLK